MTKKLDALFRFLGSLKLAVILLIGFVILLTVATFYESYTSTAQAQQVIYKTLWFDFLLLLLCINVAFSALIRFPWKKMHMGFVITHLGILIILFGAIVTRKYGVEGQIMLREGQQTQYLSIPETVISFTLPGQSGMWDYYPSFLDRPIPAGKEIHYPVGDTGIDCYVDLYVEDPHITETVTNDNATENPALQITLYQKNTSGQFSDWLFGATAKEGTIQLTVGTIQFHATIPPESYPDSVAKGNRIDIYQSQDGKFPYRAVNAAGQAVTGVLAIGEELDPGWNGIFAKISQFYENARLTETVTAAVGHTHETNPAIHVRLEKGGEKADGYVMYNTPREFSVGGTVCEVNFGQKRVPIGFTMELLDFRAPRYPGTNRPSSYESDVKVIDSAQGNEFEQ
ncbi:MAG: hypothetical protein RBU29_16560, partial [bacterium]|nr:hypothetical protein [bacterium]